MSSIASIWLLPTNREAVVEPDSADHLIGLNNTVAQEVRVWCWGEVGLVVKADKQNLRLQRPIWTEQGLNATAGCPAIESSCFGDSRSAAVDRDIEARRRAAARSIDHPIALAAKDESNPSSIGGEP